MTTAPPSAAADDAAIASLRSLLRDLDTEPRTLLAELAEARERVMGEGGLARDLDRMELDFLRHKARDARFTPAVLADAERAHRAALHNRLRSLEEASADDPAALFDLVELGAELRHAGLIAEAERAQAAVEARIDRVDDVGQRLRYEAGERFAAMSTEEEDLELTLRTLRIDSMRHACARLAERTGHPLFRKLARRLARAWCDRTLQHRLERLLTPRGAALLENVSLLLLVAIFGLLALEVQVGPRPWLLMLDASICSFFVVEFLFKLALAPARRSWFIRNVFTDLLPALPAALFFLQALPPQADLTIFGRAVRFLRIFWVARYVRALRPILGVVRLVLFVIRGLDALVKRFSTLLNRDFVFFERDVLPLGRAGVEDLRTLCFRALRREHVLLLDLPVDESAPRLAARARALTARLHDAPADPELVARPTQELRIAEREIPVEHAIDYLWRLDPADLGLYLPRKDVLALDRVARIVNAPLVRVLPFFRKLRSRERAATPEERVVDLGRRVGLVLERARERVLHIADMQGIVTGPQVLDRVASALVKASQRPAVRLLMFGGLFMLVRVLVGADSTLGQLLSRFVATPLVVLGAVCLVVLVVGRWLKGLAGEAADKFKLTSEAHFIGLLELVKRRAQDVDLQFLSRRVFRYELDTWEGVSAIASHVREARTGVLDAPCGVHRSIHDEVYRVALLYLHFLDGALLHESDVKTTEQLLANLSLENIRNTHLGWSRRERKRLKLLAPGEGGLFRGPHVWFRFITESVAVETAKRVTDYNRCCLTLAQREVAGADERRRFARWLRQRRAPELGRLERTTPPGGRDRYRTTEFNALDFLSEDPQRARHIERVFGRGVLRLIRRERERIVRDIFGTRPLHDLPRSQRTLNVYRFYLSRLSAGRVFLVPVYALGLIYQAVRLTVQKTVQTVREILAPEAAVRRASSGRASFAVALRKISRMRGPTLIEAMRTRVQFDPVYCGAPPAWTLTGGFDDDPEVERDMAFLGMRERDREPLRRLARQNRERIQELHHLLRRHPLLPGQAADDPEEVRLRGERAVTIAYMTDRDDLRTLLRAERFIDDRIVAYEDPDTDIPAHGCVRFVSWLWRGCRRHEVERFLRERLGHRQVSRRGRRNFRRAWHDRDEELRRTVRAWAALPANETPAARGLRVAGRIYATRDDIGRELAALRAIQSLSVLDIRNYRKLVFHLGNYAADGEDPTQVEVLP